MSRAITLHKRHSKAELVAMAEALRADYANRSTSGLYLYNEKTRKKLDDIAWAIRYHIDDERKLA